MTSFYGQEKNINLDICILKQMVVIFSQISFFLSFTPLLSLYVFLKVKKKGNKIYFKHNNQSIPYHYQNHLTFKAQLQFSNLRTD